MRRFVLFIAALFAAAAAPVYSGLDIKNGAKVGTPPIYLQNYGQLIGIVNPNLYPSAAGGRMVACTADYSVNTTGGSACYVWNPTSTAPVNGIETVTPTGWGAAAGRWLMNVPTGGIDVRAAGAWCDGVHDDTIVINQMFSVMGGNGSPGGVARIPSGRTCYINGTVTIPPSRALVGDPGAILGSSVGSNIRPQLLIGPLGKIRPTGGALRDLSIISSSLGFDPVTRLSGKPATVEQAVAMVAGWNAGTQIGISLEGSWVVLENLMVVGFKTCIRAIGGYSGFTMSDIHLDCINGLEMSGQGSPSHMRNLFIMYYATANLDGHSGVQSATVRSGAAGGYANGNVVTMATGAIGAACTTYPTMTLTVVAGSVTAATPLDVGDCLDVPGGFATFPPDLAGVSFTGGSGTGLTLDLKWIGPRTRPGDGIYLHDDNTAALKFDSLNISPYKNGIRLSNVVHATFDKMSIESGSQADLDSTAILTENCANFVKFDNAYLSSHGVAAKFMHKSVEAAGCVQGFVTLSNTTIGSPQIVNSNLASIHLGPESSGMINNLVLAGPASTLNGYPGTAVWADANLVGWSIDNVLLAVRYGPWITVDPTSVGKLKVTNILTSFYNRSPGELGTPLTLCGAAPAMVAGSNNERGSIMTGTGAPVACTMAFGAPWPNTPTCTANTDNPAVGVAVTAASTTSVTFGLSAGLTSGRIAYRCGP